MERHFVDTAETFVFYPYLKKARSALAPLHSWDRGTSGRWHIHCAIELPSHFEGIALEKLICDCWAKVQWGHRRILIRDGANAGWKTVRNQSSTVFLTA